MHNVESDDPLAAMLFMREGKFGVEVAPRRLSTKLARSLESSLGSRQRWMWDFRSLAYELQQAGSCNIRRCVAGETLLIQCSLTWKTRAGSSMRWL